MRADTYTTVCHSSGRVAFRSPTPASRAYDTWGSRKQETRLFMKEEWATVPATFVPELRLYFVSSGVSMAKRR